MSQTMLSEFRAMGSVAERTRRLLVQRAQVRPLTAQQRSQLDDTLHHLAAVREGFQLSLRTGRTTPDELRAIVRYTLYTIDWRFLEELGLTLQGDDQVQRLGVQLMAFAHATIALGVLPLLPPSEVSHPSSSHYRDLPTPRRPGEWLERIEELESVLTRLQSDHWNWPSSSSLRRTHAYFDATAWLIREHLGRFGSD
ncbi:MAG: hypothetical protein M3220_14650 [Chloroflexota bacterium]|nr:hypothetical protein [Chloroflexota bacterium]